MSDNYDNMDLGTVADAICEICEGGLITKALSEEHKPYFIKALGELYVAYSAIYNKASNANLKTHSFRNNIANVVMELKRHAELSAQATQQLSAIETAIQLNKPVGVSI